jgi:outer membrane murein-binding lipoprotein Lpp
MELQEIESQQPKTEVVEQDELREQKADARRSYQERIGAELKEWAAKVDHLKAEVEKSGAELGRMFEKQIEILRDKQKGALRRLSTLKRSREEKWEEFRTGLERSLDDLKQTLDHTLSTFRLRQQEVAGRVSQKRKAYIDRMEARFSDLTAKVDALKTKMEKAKSQAIMKYDQQIEELRKKQLLGKEKLEEFMKSSGESWEDLKEGMDRAFSDMKRSFEKALAKMKKR